jgi:glycosyltransferase involved in cell wall biosynthesis
MEGALPNNVEVIYQGFDFDQIVADTKRALEIAKYVLMTPEKFSILCVSRFSRVKGQTHLLDALVKSEFLKEKCKIFFIGIGDSRWLKREIDLRELNDSCSILGESVEVLEYMQACDIVVHPSLADSFSQTIIEAMGIGKCVVAANTAAVPEQIEHGKTGLIFPQGDVDTMIEHLEILISDRNLLKRLGDSAYKAVRVKFKLEEMVERYLEEFQKTNDH